MLLLYRRREFFTTLLLVARAEEWTKMDSAQRNRMGQFLVFFLVFVLGGCGTSSLEEFQYEGEAQCRKLVKILEKVETREELARALPELKKQFNALSALAVKAKEYQRAHPEEGEIDPCYFDHPYADALKEELLRIYRIEEGRAMIEKAEREALITIHSLKK